MLNKLYLTSLLNSETCLALSLVLVLARAVLPGSGSCVPSVVHLLLSMNVSPAVKSLNFEGRAPSYVCILTEYGSIGPIMRVSYVREGRAERPRCRGA